jgi:hypothetical protein
VAQCSLGFPEKGQNGVRYFFRGFQLWEMAGGELHEEIGTDKCRASNGPARKDARFPFSRHGKRKVQEGIREVAAKCLSKY